MKILLYAEGLKTIGKSGLGKAIQHQRKALEDENIDYTVVNKLLDTKNQEMRNLLNEKIKLLG